jgi:hypothetical protein
MAGNRYAVPGLIFVRIRAVRLTRRTRGHAIDENEHAFAPVSITSAGKAPFLSSIASEFLEATARVPLCPGATLAVSQITRDRPKIATPGGCSEGPAS